MKSSNAEILKKIRENTPIFQGARRSDIAMQIRGKMAEKGLKNVDIAERLGVSEANVSRWLKGNQNLSLDTLYQLADAVSEPLNIMVGSLESATVGEGFTEDVTFTCSVKASAFAPEISVEPAKNFVRSSCNIIELSVYAQMRSQIRKSESKTFAVARSESGIGEYEELKVK